MGCVVQFLVCVSGFLLGDLVLCGGLGDCCFVPNFVWFPVVLVCGDCAIGCFLVVGWWYFLSICWLFVVLVANLVC